MIPMDVVKRSTGGKPAAHMVCDRLVVGYLVVLMYAPRGVPVCHHDGLAQLYICFNHAKATPGAMFIRVSPGWGCSSCSADLHNTRFH